SGNEIERVIIGAKIVTRFSRYSHEGVQLVEALVRQQAVMREVEQTGGGLAHRRWAICSGAKMHTAFAVIAKIQLGKCGLIAPRECRLGAALLLQLGEREL